MGCGRAPPASCLERAGLVPERFLVRCAPARPGKARPRGDAGGTAYSRGARTRGVHRDYIEALPGRVRTLHAPPSLFHFSLGPMRAKFPSGQCGVARGSHCWKIVARYVYANRGGAKAYAAHAHPHARCSTEKSNHSFQPTKALVDFGTVN